MSSFYNVNIAANIKNSQAECSETILEYSDDNPKGEVFIYKKEKTS